MLGFLESPKKPNKGFILNTAYDYDLDVSEVEFYYNMYGASPEFYEKMEELVKI